MGNKNFWILLIFLLCGLVIGGLIGELAGNIDWLWWLSFGQQFGLDTPFVLNLSILSITFALSIKINIASIKEYTSIDIARQILNLNETNENGSLSFLRDISINELIKIKGLGRVKALQLKAVCELAKRMNIPSDYRKIVIKEPNDVVKILSDEMQHKKVEVVKIILLDIKNTILKIKDVAIGRK